MMRQTLANEIRHEGTQTQKILERIPIDKWDWKPHEKSTKIGSLALHVAEIPKWTSRILSTSEFDIASMVRLSPDIHSNKDLVYLSETNILKAVNDLQNASAEALTAQWTLRHGDHIVFTLPRAAVIRAMAMNHLVHHRGQLSVYLRLLDIPVPGMYGPSADELMK